MKKRIDLIAPPFKGHLIPILGLGRQLADQYDVRVISSPGAMADTRAAGLEGVEVMAKNEPTLFSIANPPYRVGSNPFRLNRQFKEAIRVMVELGDELRLLWETEPPDLVIADFVVPVAGAVAEKLGIPWWTSMVSPCVIETPDGPPAYLGGWPLSPSLIWQARYALGRTTVRLFKTVLFEIYKPLIRQAGVKHLYRKDGSEAVYSPERILALGLPKLEFRKNWPQAVEFMGPMLYSPPTPHAPPTFETGKRYVLVTLGTHQAWHKDAFAKVVYEVSLQIPETIFHFSDGVAEEEYIKENGNFKRYAFIHYPTAIDNYDVIMHHGGTGIMYHALNAGKPSIVYPLDYDQFDHAARLVHHGLAIQIKSPTPASLAKLIKQVAGNNMMKNRCQAFSRRCSHIVQQKRVLELVNDHFNKGPMCESL